MRAADSDALLNLAVLDAQCIALVLHTQRAAPDASTCCQQIVPMANAVAQTIITFMQELQQDNNSMLNAAVFVAGQHQHQLLSCA